MTREEAVARIKDHIKVHRYHEQNAVKILEALDMAIKALEQPEQNKGKWIHGREVSREMIGDVVTAIFYEGWECSECHVLVEDEREPLWKFCPICGADMREGEQE